MGTIRPLRSLGAGEDAMMRNVKQGPRRVRGSASGALLFWLVAAATAAGFVYLLVRDDSPHSRGTPEEIAERVRPVGRVVLATPPGAPASAPQASAPASAGPQTTAAVQPDADGPKGKEPQIAETPPTPSPGAAAPPEAQRAEAEPAEIARTAREPALADSPQPPSPADTDTSGQSTPEPAAASGGAADAPAVMPVTDGAAPAVADPEPPVAAVPLEPASGALPGGASVPAAAPRAGSFPPGPGNQVPSQPAVPPLHAPPPIWPQPPVESGRVLIRPPARPPQPAYEMIWIQRYDLPGQPYELRPAPRQSR